MATLILILILSFMALFSLLIKLDSRGSVFFIQGRMGRNRSTFKCIKFRTMFIDGDVRLRDYLESNKAAKDEWGKFAKLRSFDPRVTRVGNFLRKLSLDELPQLFNVLLGQMSLVGPRPYLPQERKEIGKDPDLILETPPGISGLWQVSGRSELSFNERVALDTWYIRNWSLWLDAVILLKTFKAVLTGKGAY
jgi:Undecaprenyl-phosphate galactose phosphotransferase WbaP